MMQYTRRAMLPLTLAAFVLAACAKGDNNALSEDTALNRDLARLGTDSAVQPELQDIPAQAEPAPLTPSPAPVKQAPKPKPAASAPKPASPVPTPAPANPTPNPPAANSTPSGNTVTTGAVGSEKPLGTIGAGTTLSLASTEKVCTNTHKVGDRFVSTVSSPVTGTNGAVIPAGARVTLELTKLKRSENTNDRIEIGLRVVSIAFDGKTYTPDADIVTAEIDRVRSSTKGNDAKKVLGGAVAGAILGQVLGKDTKGTVIGAAAGAAAGGAAAAATANYEGCVNNGAAITIKLNSTITVAAS
ncbi:MAG: hypothetical protein MNPFHGCM_01145 [Gemmatimonadaceae bacterium]|nr:hypothetical protein [Gemmatimonadaceae bacterium]